MTGGIFENFRRGSSAAQTVPVFTNRVSEVDAFDSALLRHKSWKQQINPRDFDAPRKNVFVFYGVGGIGKSSLVRELDKRFTSQDSPTASLIINFEDPTAFDLEDLLLRLRATVGRLGVKCVAFDFALSYYWEVVHPGMTIETYTSNSSALRKITAKLGFSEQIESSVVEVVSSIVSASQLAHGATRLAQAVKTIVADRYQMKHALRECDLLTEFLNSDTVEANLSFMPSLLAWDLKQAGDPEVVFFLDTYEEVTKRGRPTERMIQRICYLLPNALFVIAGRNRLDWSNNHLRGTLDFVGPQSWPSLGDLALDNESDQMLVGDLSAEDADRYLCDRLRKDGAPAIPLAIRSQIVRASEGWPLYLDVAVGQYQEAMVLGTLDSTNFAEPFAALVTRLSSDLTVDERDVLHAAALFTSFDEALLDATADSGRTAVRRVMARSFVKDSPSTPWPHSLHAALREALHVDTGLSESWTMHDWKSAARRALGALSERCVESSNRSELAACVSEGLGLSHRYDIDAPWLSNAALKLSRANGLSSIHYLGDSSTRAGALSGLLQTIASSREMPRHLVPEVIQNRLHENLGPADVFWAKTIQASSFLDSGHLQSAEILYRQILSDPPESDLLADARTMYLLTLLKRGAFRELEDKCDVQFGEIDAYRLMGDVHRLNARWQDAGNCYERGLERALSKNDVGLAALFRAELALVDGWTARDDPSRWVVEDQQQVATWTQVSQLIAEALYLASSDADQALQVINLASEVADSFGMQEAAADVTVARAFLAAVRGDTAESSRLVHELTHWVEVSGTYQSWLAVVRIWAGEEDQQPDLVDWLDGWDSASEAWSHTVRSRVIET